MGTNWNCIYNSPNNSGYIKKRLNWGGSNKKFSFALPPGQVHQQRTKRLLLQAPGASSKVLLGSAVASRLLKLHPSQELLQRDFAAWYQLWMARDSCRFCAASEGISVLAQEIIFFLRPHYCTYDVSPDVPPFESGIGTPCASSDGVILNTCSVDEKIEKSMLSPKNRPGHILQKMEHQLVTW